MNTKILSAALGLSLTIGAFTANAQKAYTSGVVSFPTEVRGQPADAKTYFTADSSATVITFGAGSVKMLATAKHDYFALVLDIPVAGIKKAGIATPAEMEETMANIPTFTYTPSTEAKVISGFNCTKTVAKDNKSGKSYDIWVTKDVTLPPTATPYYYKGVEGFPIKYTAFQQGEELDITVTTITGDKAPAGTFGISSDVEKGSMADLMPGQ